MENKIRKAILCINFISTRLERINLILSGGPWDDDFDGPQKFGINDFINDNIHPIRQSIHAELFHRLTCIYFIVESVEDA